MSVLDLRVSEGPDTTKWGRASIGVTSAVKRVRAISASPIGPYGCVATYMGRGAPVVHGIFTGSGSPLSYVRPQASATFVGGQPLKWANTVPQFFYGIADSLAIVDDTWSTVRTLSADNSSVVAAAWSPDDMLIYGVLRERLDLGKYKFTFRAWNSATGRIEAEWLFPNEFQFGSWEGESDSQLWALRNGSVVLNGVIQDKDNDRWVDGTYISTDGISKAEFAYKFEHLSQDHSEYSPGSPVAVRALSGSQKEFATRAWSRKSRMQGGRNLVVIEIRSVETGEPIRHVGTVLGRYKPWLNSSLSWSPYEGLIADLTELDLYMEERNVRIIDSTEGPYNRFEGPSVPELRTDAQISAIEWLSPGTLLIGDQSGLLQKLALVKPKS